jgi:hypothetical protein
MWMDVLLGLQSYFIDNEHVNNKYVYYDIIT